MYLNQITASNSVNPYNIYIFKKINPGGFYVFIYKNNATWWKCLSSREMHQVLTVIYSVYLHMPLCAWTRSRYFVSGSFRVITFHPNVSQPIFVDMCVYGCVFYLLVSLWLRLHRLLIGNLLLINPNRAVTTPDRRRLFVVDFV